jgi:hypothetical protein
MRNAAAHGPRPNNSYSLHVRHSGNPAEASNTVSNAPETNRPIKEHDFSRAEDANEMEWALQAAENPTFEGFVKGHDFSRADKPNEIDGALAPATYQPTAPRS